MDYVLHIVILVGIYTSLAVSLDLLAGHTGILSIAQAAFYGLGAYSSALLAVHQGAPFLVGVVVGIGIASLLSLVISLMSLRLHDDYFVIATFAFQMILLSILNNWTTLTHGALGIAGVPQPEIFGWVVRSRIGFVGLTGIFAVGSYVVVGRLSGSAFGRVLRAIREDKVFVQATGKNTLRYTTIAFAVSAALAATAGSLYAHYAGFVDPKSFTVAESILVISMVIIGGAGSRWGPFVGAMILVVLPEVLRFLGLPAPLAAHLRQIIYGALLVTMMMFRPNGLLGKYRFGR